jgi:hypothetical protein
MDRPGSVAVKIKGQCKIDAVARRNYERVPADFSEGRYLPFRAPVVLSYRRP